MISDKREEDPGIEAERSRCYASGFEDGGVGTEPRNKRNATQNTGKGKERNGFSPRISRGSMPCKHLISAH